MNFFFDSKYRRQLAAVSAVVLIGGAIALIESQKVMSQNNGGGNVLSAGERNEAKAALYDRAIDISTPDGFINAEPFSLAQYVGEKVILVDFWTYSCINCQRTLPYLESWHEAYADDGLLIVGVHTPEFEFEQELENVRRAVEKYGVTYPVILDNDYSTWSSYKNRYWPRKYLIDIDGYIVYDHIGEGAYEETETKIVELLNERKSVLAEVGSVSADGAPRAVDQVDFAKVKTPETYLGSTRIQYLVNLPSRSCLSGTCTYSFTGDESFAGYELMGAWTIDQEFASLTSETGAIRITFNASKVNLVAGSDAPVVAEAYVDGEKVGEVVIEAHDLYNVVDLMGVYGEHVLELRFSGPGIKAFAFTFG